MVEVGPERTMDMGVVGVNSLGYEMFDLASNRTPRDEFTDAAARYLSIMQTPEGSGGPPGAGRR